MPLTSRGFSTRSPKHEAQLSWSFYMVAQGSKPHAPREPGGSCVAFYDLVFFLLK